MAITPQEVLIYVTPDGKKPYEDWFNSCKDKATRGKVLGRITRLLHGHFGDCKLLSEDLGELRIFGSACRVYYGVVDPETVVLLWGGVKRRQSDDIKQAQEYWDELRRRDDE